MSGLSVLPYKLSLSPQVGWNPRSGLTGAVEHLFLLIVLFPNFETGGRDMLRMNKA